MRIISGYLGSRIFDSPSTHRTHPMSEKMRSALFNALGDIKDLTVLDAYGGSGALAFEAISRGAKRATIVEVDKIASRTISQNTEKLDIESVVKNIRANISGWSEKNEDKQFDILFADPPYNDIKPHHLDILSKHVDNNGLLVLSLPSIYIRPDFNGFKRVFDKNYSDGSIVIYRKI